MKKFLAVLLAVAILGVAGAAFAGADVGHVPTKPADSGKTTEVDTTALKAAAEKHVKETSVDSVKTSLGESFDVQAVTNSKDIVDAYAENDWVVAVVLPTIRISDSSLKSKDVAIKVSFDTAYAGKNVSVDLGETDTTKAKINLAADAAPYFEDASGNKNVIPANGEMTLKFVANNGKSYTPKGFIAASDVADLADFKSAVKTYSDGVMTSEDKKQVAATLSTLWGETITSEDIYQIPDNEITKMVASSDKKAVLALGKFAKSNSKTAQVFKRSNLKPSNAKSDSAIEVEVDGDNVKVAAVSKKSILNASYAEQTKVFSGAGFVAIKADDTTAHTFAVVADKDTGGGTGPTSSKGSGGCNGGFAGIAVLALGLAALRRKAR